jgi:hypothetical protein
MGKYTSSARKAPEKPKNELKFGTSMFGCLTIIIIGAVSIGLGILLINIAVQNNWPIPIELRGYMTLPSLFYKSSGLMIVFGPLLRINNLYAYVVASFVLMILVSGLFAVVYVGILNMTKPRDPFYTPPPSTKVNKKYKR